MSIVTCETGMCPAPAVCIVDGKCAMAEVPVVTTAGPREASEPEPMQQQHGDISLDSWRARYAKMSQKRWSET